MKLTFHITLLAVVAGFLLGSPTLYADDRYAPDEIIVKIKPGKQASFSSTVLQGRATVKRDVARLRYQTLKVKPGQDRDKLIESLRKNPSVEYAGPNHRFRVACSVPIGPADPLFRDGIDLLGLGIYYTHPQWGLLNDGYNNGNGGNCRADIKAVEAWQITTGNPDIVIAVLDTGLDYTHEDLMNKIWINPGEVPGNGIDDDNNGYIDDWRGWNFNGNNNDPMDDHNEQGMQLLHGSFVSGIAAAETNNGVGIAGVTWDSPVMALKVMASDGTGLEDDAATAVIYAVDNGAKIINMSLTGEDAPMLRDAIDYAWANGAVIVCASGNANISTPTYPASYPNALAVGATNEYDQRWVESGGLGGSGGSNYGDYLDVVAPGANILSATNILEQYNGYFVLSGTSAAAPFVSGIAALIWSVHPEWTNEDVVFQIKSTCDPIGGSGWKPETGWGRVNAFRAVTETVNIVSRVYDAKQQLSASAVKLTGAVATTSSGELPGRIYVQDANNAAGILLSFSGSVPEGILDGDVLEVMGTIGVVSGERAILNPSVKKVASVTPKMPRVMRNPAVGGGPLGRQDGVVDRYSLPRKMAVGTNNIGLLVQTWGKVTAVGYDWFYIDDESGLDDGSPYKGILVHSGSLIRPGLGAYALITGVSSCEKPAGSTVLRRVLRPRRQDDIQAWLLD